MPGANNFITQYFQKWADRRPRQYVAIWTSWMAFAGWSFAGSAWGWNVWVDPIFDVFYGDEPKTMANGHVVYAFSLIAVVPGFGLAALSLSGLTGPGLELDFCCLGKTKRWIVAYYWISLLVCPFGLCLLGIAVLYKQVWLLYVGAFFHGLAFVFSVPFIRALPSVQYSNVGLRGVGAGLVSCFPGIWAAAFSYWATALTTAWSVQGSMFFAAGVGTIVGLCAVPFGMVDVPDHTDRYPNTIQEKKSIDVLQKNDSFFSVNSDGGGENISAETQLQKSKPSPPVKLTAMQLLFTRQAVVLNLALFCAFSPAFGTKYLISPMLNAVYDASSSTQNLASFLFLFIYALGRFFMGPLDRYINPIWAFRGLLLVVTITYPILSTMAKDYSHSASLTGFIVCQCIIGFCLGCTLTVWVLLVFNAFSAINLVDGIAITYISFGFAGLVGPVIGWWSLTGGGNQYLADGVTYNPDFIDHISDSVAAFGYIGCGFNVAALICTIWIYPIDFSKYQGERDPELQPEEIHEEQPLLRNSLSTI